MLANLSETRAETVRHEFAARIAEGFRFVTMTCTDLGDAFDILYHLEKDHALHNLRLRLGRTEDLQSVSDICFAAVLIENEIQDLFGIKVRGLALDFEGKLLLSEGAPVAPQRRDAPATEKTNG